jgi:hypothetical protein
MRCPANLQGIDQRIERVVLPLPGDLQVGPSNTRLQRPICGAGGWIKDLIS